MFGINLKKLRLSYHYSIEKLTKKLNGHYNTHISKSMISRWEQGKVSPQLSYVLLIADYFNVNLNDLICGTNVNNNLFPAESMEIVYHLPILKKILNNDLDLAKAKAKNFQNVLKSNLADGQYFLTKINDNSMLPSISNNSLLLVKETKSIINNEIVTVLNTKNHNLYTRRFYKKDQYIILTSDNNINTPIILNVTWPGKIIGKVIKIISFK